ncbi:polypeptide N-acetylgalactosaminyltransferase 13-like [Dreissena polymorpha]|nr:polypeptide N-acetylgalactosaminyltransferase 13-like [Dreissena polymorpha]
MFVLIFVFVSNQLHLFKDRQLLDLCDCKPHSSNKYMQTRLSFLPNENAHKLVKATYDCVHQLTWSEYQKNSSAKTGNVLIDKYGKNDLNRPGENGTGVHLVGKENEQANQLVEKLNINVLASDKIPLNRMVPDSRFDGCRSVTYENDLPTASIIIPFFDEWPSILLRTIYSIVNRTPRKLLKEIILVDDGSQMKELKSKLDAYLESHFPVGLVKMIRVPNRLGLIQARLMGYRNSTGDIIIFFDSHMEVNIDWLQPLLTEVKHNRKTIAMATLDYIQKDTMAYTYYKDYMIRYGFNWRLVFYEEFFRNDQVGPKPESTRPGTVMVGAAYAIDRQFFQEIGEYDEGMKVWGGENLEMSWRIWLCGGRLVHTPCSHIGHVARYQPYNFPGGRVQIEQYNYKRAIEVWMEDEHKQIIYNSFPDMMTLDVGDLSARRALRARLQCKPFSWFMENIWPELFSLNRNVLAWGSARNLNTSKCLDNNNYLFQSEATLLLWQCHYQFASQGFSMTRDGRLRTSLQCVVVKGSIPGVRPKLEGCINGPKDTWTHSQSGFIRHESTGLCLDIDEYGVIMQACDPTSGTQLWQFNTYVPYTRR